MEFVQFLSCDNKTEKIMDDKSFGFKFGFIYNEQKFQVYSIYYMLENMNHTKRFVESLESQDIVVDACIFLIQTDLSPYSSRVIKMLSKYLGLKAHMVSVVCIKENIEDFEAKVKPEQEKQLKENIKIDFKTITPCFLTQYPLNSTLNKICSKYRNDTQSRVTTELSNILNDKSSTFTIRSLDCRKIHDIYFKINWSNRVDLQGIDLDLNECALLSSSSKNERGSVGKLKEMGWMELTKRDYGEIPKNFTNIDYNYNGVVFLKEELDQVLIAIAHRGTQFDHLGNVIADLEIVDNGYTQIVRYGLELEKRALDYVIKNVCRDNLKKTVRLVHVGFSLGGFIAAFCAKEVVNYTNIKRFVKYGVSLDAPGVLKDILRDEDLHSNVVNYFIVPNLVNTCNQHIGKKYQICDDSLNVKTRQGNVDIELALSQIHLISEELDHTLRSHNLDLLLDLTRNSLNLRRVRRWPLAETKVIKSSNGNSTLKHKRDNDITYF